MLENIIAEQKAKAAIDLREVKVALEKSQKQAKVSLDQQIEQLSIRTTKGEDHKVSTNKIR